MQSIEAICPILHPTTHHGRDVTCKHLEGQSEMVVILIKFLLHCFPPISFQCCAGFESVTLRGDGNNYLEKENYFLWSLLHASPNHKHTWFPIIALPNLQFNCQQQPTKSLLLIFYGLIPSPKPAGLLASAVFERRTAEGERCWGTCGIGYRREGSNAKIP